MHQNEHRAILPLEVAMIIIKIIIIIIKKKKINTVPSSFQFFTVPLKYTSIITRTAAKRAPRNQLFSVPVPPNFK